MKTNSKLTDMNPVVISSAKWLTLNQWQDALPDDVLLQDVCQSSSYAVVLVVPVRDQHCSQEHLISHLPKKVASVLDAWSNKTGWQSYGVNTQTMPKTTDGVDTSTNDDRLTCTYVFRYVLLASADVDAEQAAAQIKTLSFDDVLADLAFDCHILPLATAIRPHRLAFFDMDSTLIEQEVIVELAKHAGIGEQVSKITESAMRGEIDFIESFTQRVALLEGLSTDVLNTICQSLVLSAGAKTLLNTLKAAGYHTVLVSGGFTYFAQHVAKQLGIDDVYANELDIADNKVTGKVVLPVVDGKRKAHIVKSVAERLKIPLEHVICVGDGANDLPMMAVADMGIAYHAKPLVQSQADAVINHTGLDGVMHLLTQPV